MANALLEVNGISKVYGKQKVLENITFDLLEGEVCGLVGENGAGKTTFLRILAGLLSGDSGEIKGEDLRIGSIIESPSLYPNLSALDNLLVFQKRFVFDVNLELILKKVGLSQEIASKKLVKDFSLGMKQRLAIALSLLAKPKLLILDEPVNGLDPNGIKELRDLIKYINKKEGVTILVSSHILSELEVVCDKYLIMHQGKILKILRREEVDTLFGDRVFLRTTNNKKIGELLLSSHITYEEDGSYIVFVRNDRTVMEIVNLVISNGVDLEEVFIKKFSFEEYYLSLISNKELL